MIESIRYKDKMANMVVIGSLLSNPSLLDDNDKYNINQGDFIDRLHKVCFVSINNLFINGLKLIQSVDVYNYIHQAYPSEEDTFLRENGQEFLNKCLSLSKQEKFDFYYNRMKKFSLLRLYDGYGIDMTQFYNDKESDFEKRANQENWLNSNSIEDIIDIIDKRMEKVKDDFKFDEDLKSETLGSDIFELLEDLEKNPSIGLPLPFGIFNTIVSGARLKKFYLTSAKSGLGKSRSMLGSAAYLSCGKYYNSQLDKWITLDWKEPVLFISTELEKSEIQTAALAFISDVNEAKILGRECISFEEKKRVKQAAKILENSPFYFEYMEDFSIKDIERAVKQNIEKNDVKYVFHDYIHTSVKILAEVSQATNGVRLREDNILFMLSANLKRLANKYGVFIQTGTQVNRSADDGDADASMLRGATAIADKADFGEILMAPSEKDKEALKKLMSNPDIAIKLEIGAPNMIRNVYKNRGNVYKAVKLWCYADLGTCRIYPLFCTTNDYDYINLPNFNIKVEKRNDK